MKKQNSKIKKINKIEKRFKRLFSKKYILGLVVLILVVSGVTVFAFTNNNPAGIDWTGNNVGIGTDAPVTQYHQRGYQNGNWISTWDNTGISGHKMYFGYNNNTDATHGLYIQGGFGNKTQCDLAVKDKFYVYGSGNVRIGTDVPSLWKLDVQGCMRVIGHNPQLNFSHTNVNNGTTQNYSIQAVDDGLRIYDFKQNKDVFKISGNSVIATGIMITCQLFLFLRQTLQKRNLPPARFTKKSPFLTRCKLFLEKRRV